MAFSIFIPLAEIWSCHPKALDKLKAPRMQEVWVSSSDSLWDVRWENNVLLE